METTQFQFSVVLIYLIASTALIFIALFLGRFIRPCVEDPEKRTIYECGERPIGGAWFTFNPRFYLLALVFIVFDVALALLFPVAVVAREWVNSGQGGAAVSGLMFFLCILSLGLAYVWGHGNLDWVRDIDEPGSSAENES
ncbi:MAG TPA: NADH-quinone oxidoreductase subunit A [Acidobacteriota bacterium]|nr:NADH-quinone oxidoreductase subunit A [Acidobacteriota bacterium]